MESTNQKNQTDYQPFGDEWKKEMMKNTKEDIVSMFQVAGAEWSKHDFEVNRKEHVLRRRLWKIIHHHGQSAQIMMLIEESSELIQAIAKFERKKFSNEQLVSIAGEIADVRVMLKQFMLMFGFTDSFIDILMTQKIDRELKRIYEIKQNEKE